MSMCVKSVTEGELECFVVAKVHTISEPEQCEN